MTQHTVRNWMTHPVITVESSASLTHAQRMMHEFNIRHLPVVDEEDVLVGILSSGDIRRARPSDAHLLSVWELNYLWDKLTVQNVMSRHVITISADAPLTDALTIMIERRFSSLPVLDEYKRLVGILTEIDLFRALAKLIADEEETAAP
jgi:acetoin utilization protein AcuB